MPIFYFITSLWLTYLAYTGRKRNIMITKETANEIIAASELYDELRDREDLALEKKADELADKAIYDAVDDGFDTEDLFWLMTAICNGSCSAVDWLSQHETEDY